MSLKTVKTHNITKLKSQTTAKERITGPIIKHINPLHAIPSHFLTIHFNIVLRITFRSPKLSFPFRFTNPNPECISLLPRACRMPCPSRTVLRYRDSPCLLSDPRYVATGNIRCLLHVITCSYLLWRIHQTLYTPALAYMFRFDGNWQRACKYSTSRKDTGNGLWLLGLSECDTATMYDLR